MSPRMHRGWTFRRGASFRAAATTTAWTVAECLPIAAAWLLAAWLLAACLLAACLLAACLVVAAPAPARAAESAGEDPFKLTYPPLHAIKPVTPFRYVMSNGIVVYLLEDHELPLVSGTAYFHASSTLVPREKVGLGALTGEVMRTGGTAAHPGDWLDDRMAALGASISTSVGVEDAEATFRSLAEDAPEVISLMADVVRRPIFPEDKIERAKVGLRRAIASRNDELIPMLVRVGRQAVYGKDSPYARTPEYATVDAVRRADCIQFHRQSFAPNRMILAVYGDFRTEDMKRVLQTALGDWKPNPAPLPALPPEPGFTPARVVFAPKNDVTQTGMLLVHEGFKASDPDYPAMDVLEMLLGGGFQSRLFNRIRTERGLAYAAGASSGAGFVRPGIFLAYSLTRADSTMAALDLLRAEVVRVTREPVSSEELEESKESVLNSFVFKFEEPSEVLDRAAFYELAGYPQDFLTRYQKGVEAVSSESLLEAARRHIHPEHLITVLTGNEKAFDRPLAALGEPVERVDVTIPPPRAPARRAVHRSPRR